MICQPPSIPWLAHGLAVPLLIWPAMGWPTTPLKEGKQSIWLILDSQSTGKSSFLRASSMRMAWLGIFQAKKNVRRSRLFAQHKSTKINTTSGPTKAPKKTCPLKSKHSFCISKSRMSTFMVGSVVLIPPTSVKKQKKTHHLRMCNWYQLVTNVFFNTLVAWWKSSETSKNYRKSSSMQSSFICDSTLHRLPHRRWCLWGHWGLWGLQHWHWWQWCLRHLRSHWCWP